MPKRCPLAVESAKSLFDRGVEVLHETLKPAGDHESEGIHDMRVASRRLRAIVSAHAPFLDRETRTDLKRRLRCVTQGLGTARELDVSMAVLRDRRKTLHGNARAAATFVLRKLQRLRDSESPNVDASVHLVTKDSFRTSLQHAKEALKLKKRCYLLHGSGVLDKCRRRLCDRHSQWLMTRAEEDLHQIRIAFKKLRYNCELFTPLYGEAMTAFIAELKQAQEILGVWNDVRILRNYVERLAPDSQGRAAEGIAELHGALDREADRLLESFEAAADRFFSPDRSSRNQAMLAAPEALPCCNPDCRLRAIRGEHASSDDRSGEQTEPVTR